MVQNDIQSIQTVIDNENGHSFWTCTNVMAPSQKSMLRIDKENTIYF